jgi:2-dehydropantoate 2-reductase
MLQALDIAILGAGAMGSLFGGVLAEAGHHVTLVDIDELQDVLAGRKTEIEAINGAVVAAGIAAPSTECLPQLVRLVDARGAC